MHTDCPVAPLNVPGGHGRQASACPGTGAYVAGGHAAHAAMLALL